MHLKEIYLENFKSFGRKIRIPLLEGFTAITGPNGSGKSNIADAILFVLGPKSSKMIRAGKLTDLIFNGGKKKKPAKYCKVSLIFNNETKLIPIDSDEVRLTRLVKLSKTNPDNYYSYYYVNGKPSSLNEFDNLLAHARISADGYNLVQQGDINHIIQMGRLDRRRILDDIAGITKFDADIDKAEGKEQDVLDNLDRIQILLDEIKNNLKQLKRDRDAAIRFKDMRDEFYQVKAQMAHKRKEDVELRISTFIEQIKKLEAERNEETLRLEEYQEKYVVLESKLKEIDDKITEMGGEEAEELQKKINELRLTQHRATDTINTCREGIQVGKEEKSGLNRELKAVQKELNQIESNKAKDSENSKKIEAELEQLKTELKKLEELRSKSSTDILELQRSISKLNHKIDSKRDEIKNQTLSIDRSTEKIERLNAIISENQEEVNKVKFEIEDITWRIKEHNKMVKESDKHIDELSKEYHQCKANERNLSKQAQELEEATNRLNREYMKLKAQKEAAESVQKNYSRTVERVLEARDRGILTGIVGTIAELAEVNDEYEKALTVAAGARMQSVVVENDEYASNAIEYIKREKLGRATFLPLNKMTTGRPRAKALMCERNEHSLGFAIDLIKFDEQYRPAFWYVFGDTVIMEDLTSARKVMGGVRLVTKSGEVIESSGAMVGGNIGTLNLRFGAPSESDFKNISELLRKTIEQSDQVSKELHSVRDELSELECKIREANMTTGSTGIQEGDLKNKKSELVERSKELDRTFKAQVADLEAEQHNLEELEKKLKQLNDEVEEMVFDREEKRETITKSTPQKLANEINETNDRLNELQNNNRDLKAELKTLATQEEMYSSRKNELKERLGSIDDRIIEDNRRIEEAKQTRESLNDELNTLLKVKDSLDLKHKELKEKRDKAFEAKVKLEGAIDKANTKITTTSDMILKTETNLQTVQDTIADIEAELANYENVEIKRPIPPLDELTKRSQRLEVAMASLEPINMRAIDDYEVQSERKEKLEDETKRLLEQQKNLLDIVNNLKTKKKEKLLVVFNGVNENFKEIYKELSNNGNAELILENPDEPFEAGMIIKARPPNKKTSRLEALSGGEKSLVSMALIFAIQQYQPSPFYVLDEVDQNLDAINAEKVAIMVKNNADTAQFLMISLRKVSLNRAHHVYGVTIQNSGITDIVGQINLNEFSEDGTTKGKVQIKAKSEIEDMEDIDIERGGMYG